MQIKTEVLSGRLLDAAVAMRLFVMIKLGRPVVTFDAKLAQIMMGKGE